MGGKLPPILHITLNVSKKDFKGAFNMSLPIFDCFDSNYKHPFGAARRGQPGIYNIRLPKYMQVSDLTLVMFRP